MKRKWGLAVVLALVCVMLLGIGVAADTVAEGTCGDDLTWVLDDAGVLTISGEGEMEDYESFNNASPWYKYRDSITSVIIKEGVTSIGKQAFASCTKLTSLVLSNQLISISSMSFYDCIGLTFVEFPKSLASIGEKAFLCCTGLTSVIFPESLTSVGDCAFYGCTVLSEIAISSNISINSCACTFYETNLHTVHISNTVTSVPDDIFSTPTINEFNVDDTDDIGLVSIDGILYEYDDYLETYTLVRYPVAKKGTEYTIINNTETIDKYAFCGCNLLNRINITDTVHTINDFAFSDCDNLSTLQWGASVTTVGVNICENSPITNIVMPENARIVPEASTILSYEVITSTGIGYKDIDGVLFKYDGELLTLYKYPIARENPQYNIPSETAIIKSCAFKDNAFLQEVFINKGITCIGYRTFEGCTGLKKVYFPKALKAIEFYAFSGCTHLKEVYFPESINTIDGDAFYSCTALRRAYFYGNAPTYCSSNAFSNTHSTFTIYYIEGKSGWTSPTWNGYNTATFVPEGYSLIPKSTSTYIFTDATITNVPAGTTVSTFIEQFDNTNISLTTAIGTSLSDTALVGTGCVVRLTVDGTVVDSRTIIVTGDMDGDGLTSATDLTLLQQYYRGYAVTIAYPAAADLNGDGKMTRADAMVLARQLAGWTDALTPPSDVIVIG